MLQQIEYRRIISLTQISTQKFKIEFLSKSRDASQELCPKNEKIKCLFVITLVD